MIIGKKKRVKKLQAIKQCYLRCLNCNNVQTIYRRKAKLREMGHFKHIYCYKCKKRTKHIEFDNNDKYSK